MGYLHLVVDLGVREVERVLVETGVLGQAGKKFEIDLDEKRSYAVLLEPEGTRTLYHRGADDEEYDRISDVSDGQARTIGLFLVGAYHQPVAGGTSMVSSLDESRTYYDVWGETS